MSEFTIIAYHPEGFEVRFTGSPDKVDQAIAWLLRNDYRCQLGFQYTPEGLPICPRHGVPMVKREKQGDVWYSHNIGTDETPLWCRGYDHSSSPGWSVIPSVVSAAADHALIAPDPDDNGRYLSVTEIAEDIFG